MTETLTEEKEAGVDSEELFSLSLFSRLCSRSAARPDRSQQGRPEFVLSLIGVLYY